MCGVWCVCVCVWVCVGVGGSTLIQGTHVVACVVCWGLVGLATTDLRHMCPYDGKVRQNTHTHRPPNTARNNRHYTKGKQHTVVDCGGAFRWEVCFCWGVTSLLPDYAFVGVSDKNGT